MRLRRRKGVGELQIRVVLCLQTIFNVLVQLLITTSGLRAVEITTSNNIQVGSCKVQCLSHDIEISDGDELFKHVSKDGDILGRSRRRNEQTRTFMMLRAYG